MISGPHLVQSVALGGNILSQLRHSFLSGVRIGHSFFLGVLWHHDRTHTVTLISGTATRWIK